MDRRGRAGGARTYGARLADVVGSPLWRAEPFATGETAALVRSSLERAFAGDGVIGFSLNMRTRGGRGVTRACVGGAGEGVGRARVCGGEVSSGAPGERGGRRLQGPQ